MISVIIPLFNKQNHIEHTLDTAEKSLQKAQVFYEIVIVDDGSTDSSLEVVKLWKASNTDREDRTKIIETSNNGVSAARNTGIQHAEYEFIAFLDADDEWTENHVIELLALAEDFPNAALYATAWAEVNPLGVYLEKEFGVGGDKRGLLPCYFEAIATGPMIVSASTAGSWKHLLQRTGGFMVGCSHGEDRIAWGNLALLGEVAFTPEIGAVWRKDAENRSTQTADETAKSTFLNLFIEPAIRNKNTPDKYMTGLKRCWLSEKARILSIIDFYDEDTPQKLNTFVEDFYAIDGHFR